MALSKDFVSRYNFTLSISDDKPIVPGCLNKPDVKSYSRIIEKELKIWHHLLTSRKLKCGYFTSLFLKTADDKGILDSESLFIVQEILGLKNCSSPFTMHGRYSDIGDGMKFSIL